MLVLIHRRAPKMRTPPDLDPSPGFFSFIFLAPPPSRFFWPPESLSRLIVFPRSFCLLLVLLSAKSVDRHVFTLDVLS